MDPATLQTLAPVYALAVIGFVLSIPLIGWSIRMAAKPLVEAIMHYKEVAGQNRLAQESLALQDRRLSLLEAELQHVHAQLSQLVEAEEFRRQLEAPAPRGIPADIH